MQGTDPDLPQTFYRITDRPTRQRCRIAYRCLTTGTLTQKAWLGLEYEKILELGVDYMNKKYAKVAFYWIEYE